MEMGFAAIFMKLFKDLIDFFFKRKQLKLDANGKRKIELAEDTLATFFEIKAAIAFIRNPAISPEEKSARDRTTDESPAHSELLDKVLPLMKDTKRKKKYSKKYNDLKPRFMTIFGDKTEGCFTDMNKIKGKIALSLKSLAEDYWPKYAQQNITEQEERHMDRRENILMLSGSEDDEIGKDLKEIQKRLEKITKPYRE